MFVYKTMYVYRLSYHTDFEQEPLFYDHGSKHMSLIVEGNFAITCLIIE